MAAILDLFGRRELPTAHRREARGRPRAAARRDPEGNKDIDPDGSDRNALEALRWKQAYAGRTDAEMAIVTQFCFEAGPVIARAERLRRAADLTRLVAPFTPGEVLAELATHRPPAP